MKVVFQHLFELLVAQTFIFVEIVFLKLSCCHFWLVFFMNQIHRFQVLEDRSKQQGKAILSDFLAFCIDLKDELSCFGIILVKRGGSTDKLIEIYCLSALEINIVEYLGCLFIGGIEFLSYLFNAELVILITQMIILILKISNLIIIKARERLKLRRPKRLIAHYEFKLKMKPINKQSNIYNNTEP